MKTLLLYIMVSVFAFNSAVGIIVIQFLQFHQKEEMEIEVAKAKKETENTMHTIVVKRGEEDKLEWTEKNREFQYNGIMYDIVRKEQQGTAIIYYCLADLEETQQVETLEKLLTQQSGDTKRTSLLKKTLRLFWSQFEFPNLELSGLYICIETWSSFYTFFTDLYERDIPTPPPRF